eukprot:scaffold6012_cov106-Isochrysis_galbana.AAC.11
MGGLGPPPCHQARAGQVVALTLATRGRPRRRTFALGGVWLTAAFPGKARKTQAKEPDVPGSELLPPCNALQQPRDRRSCMGRGEAALRSLVHGERRGSRPGEGRGA